MRKGEKRCPAVEIFDHPTRPPLQIRCTLQEGHLARHRAPKNQPLPMGWSSHFWNRSWSDPT